MKLTLAFLVYLLIGAFLGWGIYEMVHGRYWVLVTGVILYLLGFARIGCAEH